MRFDGALVEGRLRRRYKRFLADVEVDGGELWTVHCANPGRMTGCQKEGARVVLSDQSYRDRKLRYSWELVRVGRTWVGINTLRSNAVVEEALREGWIPELAGWSELQREVRVGERRRMDFRLRFPAGDCFVEVKNVTLAEGTRARFPDAVTTRGAEHMRELGRLARSGHRAVLFYLVNRQDCDRVEPAADIDPDYAAALREALEHGVEVLAYRARVGKRGIRVDSRVPFEDT